MLTFCRWLQMCTDLRLLASMKEVEEPFEKEQIGKFLFIGASVCVRCVTLTIRFWSQKAWKSKAVW